MRAVPEHLRAEHMEVERLIREAFAGVMREGGVTWNEAEALDFHWDDEAAIAAAAALDTEASWEELAENPDWIPDSTLGSWPFLDELGTRYYLAPFMIRCLHRGFCASIGNPLSVTTETKQELLGLLNQEQRRVVARFVRFMIVWTNDEDWQFAYRAFWRQHDTGTPLG